MALTTSYFIGELLIPDLIGSDAICIANRATLNRIILIREREYLTYLLGKAGYDDYITKPDDYTALTALLYDATNKISPVAAYCYFYYKQQTQSYETGGGSVSSKYENADNQGMGMGAIRAYNESIVKGQGIITTLGNTYPAMAPDFSFFSTFINFAGI